MLLPPPDFPRLIPPIIYSHPVARSLFSLPGVHVGLLLGWEALTKGTWKAVLDPEETMKVVSGLNLRVCEKCGTPGTKTRWCEDVRS